MTTLIGLRCTLRKEFSQEVLITDYANHPNTDLQFCSTRNRIGFFDVGVLFRRAPPLPIPNREVKAQSPDDTSGLGWWESRVCQDIIGEKLVWGQRSESVVIR